MAQKLKILTIIFSLLFGFVFTAHIALAEATCTSGVTAHPLNSDGTPNLDKCDPIIKDPAARCATGALATYKNGSVTDQTKCEPLGNGCAGDAADPTKCLNSSNPFIRDLNDVVYVLSGLVGVVVVGTIILGGVQYAAAGDKAEAVSAAKKRIINGITALIAFLFIFAFLQWLIPGGIFS